MKKLTDEVIFLKSLENFSTLFLEYDKNQKFQFTCEKCNHPQILQKKSIKKIQSLKCTKCRRKETNLQKYGVENIFQDTERIKKAYISKLGVSSPQQLKSIREKTKKTNQEKYGCETPLQLEKSKEASRQNWKECKDNRIERRRKTCKEKYGEIHFLKTNEGKEKLEKTCKERFGCKSSAQSEVVRQKLKETWAKKSEEELAVIREKYVSTCLERYGVESSSQSPEIRKKGKSKIRKDGQLFDSSWELKVFEFCKENSIPVKREPVVLEYEFQNKKCRYFPDFEINGKLVEVKSDYLYKKMQEPNTKENAKLKCILANGIIIWLKKDVESFIGERI